MKHTFLLWGVALLIITAPIAALSLTACETARERAGTGVAALIDCEAPHLRAAVAELVPLAKQAVKSWISGDGKVDTEKMRAACSAIVGDLGRCVMAGAVAALTAPAGPGQTVIAQPLQVPDPGALRLAFESVRGDWGGASYRTAAGVL